MNKVVNITAAAKIIGVNPQTLRRWHVSGKFRPSFVSPGGHRHYSLTDLERFMNDDFTQAQAWALAVKGKAPQLPNIVYCRHQPVFQYRLDEMSKALEASATMNMSALFVAIVGEIGNNSFDHNLGNWIDDMGIYFSYNVMKGRAVLADRGQGILTTLRRVQPSLRTHSEALTVAFTKILSGRAPENRGNGLKFVRAIALEQGFHISFQSGDALWSCENKQEKFETSPTLVPGVLVSIHVAL